MALLLTAVVNLMDKDGKPVPCRAMLDSGSQVNLLSDRMFRRLGLATKPAHISISGIGGSKVPIRDSTVVQLRSMYNDYRLDVECLITQKITGITPTTRINISHLKFPHGLQLADPTFHQPDRVDLLMGVEHFFDLLKIGHFKISEDLPELRETQLGWVVSGAMKDAQAVVGVTSIDSLDETIKKFWELEDIPDALPYTSEEQECERLFKETHIRDNSGRFVVKLPFRLNIEHLGDIRSGALRQFLNLEKRLNKHLT